jgi:hypothetical protein
MKQRLVGTGASHDPRGPTVVNVKDAFVTQNSQRTQHCVQIDPQGASQGARRRQLVATPESALRDLTTDRRRNLLVQGRR